MNLSKRIYAATRRIPRGQVATYADIARAVGRMRAWRHVGTVLSRNRDPKTPCHRVVRSDGKVGGFFAGGRAGGTALKVRQLLAEGVQVRDGAINLGEFRILSPLALRRLSA